MPLRGHIRPAERYSIDLMICGGLAGKAALCGAILRHGQGAGKAWARHGKAGARRGQGVLAKCSTQKSPRNGGQWRAMKSPAQWRGLALYDQGYNQQGNASQDIYNGVRLVLHGLPP